MSAASINIIGTKKSKKAKDITWVKCYVYYKKKHNINKYPKSQKLASAMTIFTLIIIIYIEASLVKNKL